MQRTKAQDAREITRLKKELATMRQVLKSFVAEIDSLNRLNEQLMDENADLRQQRWRRAQLITIFLLSENSEQGKRFRSTKKW